MSSGPRRVPGTDFSGHVLGETSVGAHVDTSEQVRDATRRMLEQTRRSVEIVARELDPAIYDDAAVVDALRAFATGSPRARARILARDVSRAIGGGHRLVELARRLSSFFEIRLLGYEHRGYNAAFLVADATGVVFRRFSDRYEGDVRFADPGTARDLGLTFDQMWELSESDPALRALRI